MRFLILSALLSVSICLTAAQSSGTVGYSRTTLNTAPTNLNYRAATVTSKITNASIYGITGILKGDGIGGSVLATPGVDYEPAGGGGTTVSVNGSEVSTPNFTNSATATFSVSTTNVSVNPTNLANAQIAASAAIDFSKLSGVAASVHVHAGEDITSGTVADARVAATIARDSEVTSAISALTLSGISGAVTDSQVPNDITIDLATVATTANAGDSATSFFPSGTIEDARLPGTMAGKTLTTPTIADFSNATHNHQNVAGGGTLDGAAIASGTVAAARIDSAIATDAEVAAGFQPLDSDLTALAGNGSNGLLARTGSGTVAARTITGDSEITVSNGDGVGGNPTLAIASSIARDSEVSSAVANVIHSNVAGEITAITDKATPVAADHILIEDSAASDAKKDITIASLETALEGFLDLQDLQGAVTDAQVPNTITVDLATLATTATTANSGDSATAFFSAGILEDILLPGTITRDTEWDTIGEIETATGVDIIVSTEIDSIAELETLTGANILTSTEGDAAYQPLDADLTDLADGTLTGSKVGTGIDAGNVTTGTLADGVIPGAITRDSEWDSIAEIEAATGGVNILLQTEIDTSSELAALVGDGTGSGALVFGTSPTLTTPTLGVATATTLDTGQGANELYDMDQNVLQASDVTFNSATVATEVYDSTGWNGDNTVPTKDAIRDKLDSMLPTAAMYYGSVLTPWVDTNNVISLQWKKAPQVWEFLNNSVADWQALIANSGSAAQGQVGVDDAGMFSASTGSLTNGVAGHRMSVTTTYFLTNNFAFLFRVVTPSALSTDADGYELYVGLGDSTTDAAPTDGAYFYYLHSVSNGVWCAKTANNGSATFASGAPTTPPTVVAGGTYSMLLEGNSTVVNFWISSDGEVTWQWIGFTTTNIPITSARVCGPEYYIRKVGGSVGTNSRTFSIGRMMYWANQN